MPTGLCLWQSWYVRGFETTLMDGDGMTRREMSRGDGYILAPAKPLRTETPTENAVAVGEKLLDPDV